MPYYRGFIGEVKAHPNSGGFILSGKCEEIDKETLIITEIPIRKWVKDYKGFLEELV